MLAQDPYTGNVHEVPYPLVPGVGQVLYDGLGNPVGGLFDTLLSPLKSIVSNIPLVGGLVSNLIPGGSPAPAVPVPVVPPGATVVPAAPAYAQPSPYSPYSPSPVPGYFPPRFPMRACATPVGWTTPALPYTGTQPRRLYLRCSVWPGQSGLVPVQPGQWSQAQAQAGATGALMAMRHRRSSRRRRR
jgi:hypothetical protein